MSKSLNELRDEAHSIACSKGFADANVPERIALMHSELSEALEDHRKGKAPWDEWKEDSGKPCGVPSEIADVIIRALDFCGAFRIDIERVVEEKMAYNRTRPHKHGGKVI